MHRQEAEFICTLALAATLASSPTYADVSRAVIESPLPQSQTNSCQSYSLAFLLAHKLPASFPIETAAELRSLEQEVRRTILDVGGAGKEYHWSSWKLAVSRLSGGKLKLVEEQFLDESALLDRIAELTGGSTRQLTDANLSALSLRLETPVIVSMTYVQKWRYPSGHIVTILGGSSGPQAPRKLLILNSAAKTARGDRNMCGPFDTITDRIPWSASVSVVDRYTFKYRSLLCLTESSQNNSRCN